MTGHATHALPGSGGGDELHDPGGARPIGFDVLGCLLGIEFPVGVTPVPLLEIDCSERDLALALELPTDLAVEDLLVRFDGQQEVGPLLQAPTKNACVVCRASAWISTPSRTRLLSSSLSAAFSLDSWVS